MKNFFFTLSILLASATVSANVSVKPKTHTVLDEEKIIHITNQSNKDFHYTHRELQDNPNFTSKLLEIAVSNNNQYLIQKLLPIYTKSHNNNAVLVNYAQAKLAQLSGNYSTAVYYFKKILADNPSFDKVRLELALALFRDQQNINAKNQFNKLKSSKKISPETQKLISSYIKAIDSRSEWNIHANLNYIQESNINNVSDSLYVGDWKKPDSHLPQSAQGIGYNIGISKDFNIHNKHYLVLENNVNGEKYWNNDDYNSLANRSSAGYRYKSADTTVSVLPFYTKNWSANSDYDNFSTGIKTSAYHKINPYFSYSVSGEYAENNYPKDDDFNGNSKSLSNTLYWQKTPKQSFYIGNSISGKKTNIKRFNSVSNALHLGWNQEWTKGVSSRIGVGHKKTKYGDIAKYGGLIPLDKIRKDDAYTANIALWKRDWQILGVTPKLSIDLKKQTSNIPDVYSYNKAGANIIFEKSF